jgi:subtilisin
VGVAVGGQLCGGAGDGYAHDEARQRLLDTAEDIGLEENEGGVGLVDVAAALGYDSGDDGTGDGSCPS